MSKKERRFTAVEAAEYLGVSKALIHKRIKDGKYPETTRCECGKSVLLTLNDLKKRFVWLATGGDRR